jgi:hypothetical protein
MSLVMGIPLSALVLWIFMLLGVLLPWFPVYLVMAAAWWWHVMDGEIRGWNLFDVD